MDFRIGGRFGHMVIEDQGQVASPVEIGQHRGDPAGEIGKDDNSAFLFIHLLQQSRIGFFQAKALDLKAGPFKGAGKDGT